ncbi:glucose/sorbosone family PQQ-dependent dehydrogenase [Bryobacter aggregatus]|uniref:glucose/sorbosone family PQQ-dependent dehydrogenase n=1 Tax=Bryobacter aggregatus TaxID=360054 RepID=UPI0009B5A21A|nr:glucose/sorbosone family PQQ-dependent dehydrogenase [Bryobacter aggregatus]
MKSFLHIVAMLSIFGIMSAQDGPESVVQGSKQFQKKVLASGLAGPWELTWGPDNMLWVTERIGKRVTRIDPVSGERHVAITIDEVAAPGGQDGLLGLALHPELLQGTGNDYVYVAYTYLDKSKKPKLTVADPASPYRHLYGKVVRFRYQAKEQKLSDPVQLIAGLPAGDDHTGGRLKFGPDQKLYLTIGDQGHNQLGNFCLPIEAQRLPTQKEIRDRNYASYVGKSLRLNLDGSVPADNPKLKGVVSHVFTYGHRNPQGLDFGPDGTLYSAEHGPKTDDEINVLTRGSNYGWPHVAGLRDDKAYVYARWAESSTPCSQMKYNDLAIPASVPQDRESAFHEPFVNPIATMFTVPTGFNFQDPACKGVDFICWPTVGVSDVEYYESKGKGIPGWDKVLLVTTLKRGSLYVLPLSADGKTAAGHFSRYFQSENRFRDSAVSPDGRTIYIATDPGGLAGAADAGTTTNMENPGAILAFTYTGEGMPGAEPQRLTSDAKRLNEATNAAPIADGVAPQFTAAQAARGKAAYNATCAVCHGSTMTNGAYGTPLAGEYFKTKWSHRSVRAFYDRAQKTMPPGAPGSLAPDAYADIVAYVLEVNGFAAGDASLRAGDEKTGRMVLK